MLPITVGPDRLGDILIDARFVVADRRTSDRAHRHGVLCLIDSVSGLGGAELRFDEWKLDYVLTGSQKAIAMPPGLSFAVASTSFVDQANGTAGRGVYFDLVEMRFALLV